MQVNHTNNIHQPGATAHMEAVDWRTQLDHAVTAVDEPQIWQIMAGQFENAEAHDTLATLVSRMAYATNSKPAYCEMFMVPILAQADCDVIGDKAVWKSAGGVLRDTIKGWFADNDRTIVFEGINWMDWVTTWSPRILRDHLHRVIPDNPVKTTSFNAARIDLPKNAPRLGFVNLVRVSSRGWPTLPPANALRDNRFKELMRYSLQIAAPSGPTALASAPTVLSPERVQFAIADGVSLWLTQLNEAVGIKGWVLYPHPANPDVMKITMDLDNDEVPRTQFVLRLHQIGMQGLQDVLTVLSALAPCMEIPSDMAQRPDGGGY